MITRRNVLSLLAAPAIVRASSVMRVVPVPVLLRTYFIEYDELAVPLQRVRLLGWKDV